MLWNIRLPITGLAALTLGAESLVRSSPSLAVRAGITLLVIWLTVVVFGNIVCSNIFNIPAIFRTTFPVNPLSTTVVTHLGLWTMVVFSAGLFPILDTGLPLQR